MLNLIFVNRFPNPCRLCNTEGRPAADLK